MIIRRVHDWIGELNAFWRLVIMLIVYLSIVSLSVFCLFLIRVIAYGLLFV